MSQSDADDEDVSEVESIVFDPDDMDKHTIFASKLALLAATGQTSSLEALDGDSSLDECLPVDAETQARLEALLEAAGIGKLSTSDGKAFAEPEVLRRLTSSVSCALDEAAAALSRMRAETATQQERSLAEACSDGDINLVKRLLEEGRSVHETTEDGESLLSLACSAGYYELAEVLLSVPPLCHESVYLHSESAKTLRNKMNSEFLQILNYQLTKVLLAMHANVEDRGSKGECTPLMEAASGGYKEIVQLLLRHKADVNAKSSTGNTALAFACCGGYVDIVKILIDAGAELEVHNENGHTPLMEAASGGHVEVAMLLLQHGVGINTHSNEFKESALTLACYKGHLEMVRFLLEAGADQEHKTDEMHTALMEASMDGHVDVARLLLDSGAQVNMPADSFESPLTLAACGGHVELASLLLERGASLEEVNDEGYTPLMEAAREGHGEMVAVLLAHGANVNAQTEETQETALTLACCGGFLDCAELLINFSADLELGCSTPLMEAAQEGHLELVKYLIRAGADVNHATSSGETALTVACEHGHTDIADELLKDGANLEQEAEGGRTPLMKAARAGQYCMVQYLISQGASVNRTTRNNDHSVLSLACVYGHLPVVELLLHYGADSTHILKDGSTMLLEAAKGGHSVVVQCLLDYAQNLYNTSNQSAAEASAQPPPTSQDESTSRVPTQSLPMIVPPQEPDKSPCVHQSAASQHPPNIRNAADIITGADKFLTATNNQFQTVPESSVQQELATSDQNNLRSARAYAGSVKPIPPPPVSLQNSYANDSRTVATVANGAAAAATPQQQQTALDVTDSLLPLLSVDNEVRVHVESFLRTMTSGSTGLPKRTTESIVEHAQEKLTELEHRIKEAIENNAQSPELLQTEQLTKEKVEEMYKTREEQIQKKQKILEELQKVERDLQMKTHQQLKKHYMEVKAGKEQPPVADTPTEPELLPPGASQIPLRRGKPDGEDSPRFPAQQIPQPIPSVSHPPSDIPTTSTATASVPSTQPAIQEKRAPPAPAPPTCKHGPPINFPPEAIPPHLKEQLIRKRRNTFNADDSSEDGDSYPPHQHVHHHECNHHPCTTPHLTHPSTPSPHPFRGDSPAYNAEDTGGEFHQSSEMRNAFPALNINCFTESNHDTPLSLACAGGYDDLVQLLISRGAQVEHRDKKGFTPLILAATAGHTGVVQILLDANADIESQSERTKDTPLSLSCSGGREDVVRLLLERGANKEHRNVSDYTPLSLAASGGYVNIIKLLLNYNAEINSRTGSKLGISPLMLAAMNGHTTAVQLLLDMGADINAQIETNRNTALTLACFQGRHEVVEILVNRRANVEHRAKTGLTPLMEAASGGYAEVGKVLLEKGADVNAPPVPSSRDTALTIAADKGHYRFCELVLSIWAAVDARNKKGNTPLWLACNGGHLDVAQLLVEHNADVNAADNRNITPLMAAFRKGHYKVVRWLVDEVSQFPSDEECMRYLTSIAHDRELFHRGRQCMEYIAAARERQAQEANKYASELLHEIDMEKSREETRRVRAAKKRNRRRLKKRQKSNQDSKKDDQDEDQVETTEEVEKEDKTPEKANKEVEKKQNEENKKMKDVAEATVKKGDKAKENKMNVLKSAENILKTEKNHQTKASKKKETKPTTVVPMAAVEAEPKTDANSKSKTPKESKVANKPKTPPLPVETKKVQVSTEVSKPPKSSIPVPDPVEATSRNTAAVAPTSQKKTSVSRRSSAKSHARDTAGANSKRSSASQSKTTPAPSPGKRSQRRSAEEGWKEVTRSNFSVKSKCVMVSSSSISRVIGRGGCNINAIREVTSAHIDIDKQRKGGHERTVTIKGSVKSIKMASQLINELTKPDITDEEVTTIIANARSEAAANAVSAAATLAATSTSTSPAANTQSSSMARPVAVVEAPLPTRPAWTKPPSIITNQPQRANNGVALTQSSVWPNPTSLPPSRFPESEEKSIPTPQEPLVIASVPPSVETVKKALFTPSVLPSASSSTVSNSGKLSNSSSACSTPVPHATSISPPAVKQVQKPTTFASVSPHIVHPASEVDTKPVVTAAIVTPTSVQAHPAPVTFPPKSSDKVISRPVQPVAPMPAKPQQQFMTNTNIPVAHSMPSRQMMPPSPAAEHMMQYNMQRQQAEHPNSFHPNNPTSSSQQQRNMPHTHNQNTGMSVDGKPAFDSRMGVPEMMQSAGQGGYSHYSAFGMKPSSPWNAESKNSLPSPGGINMSKPQPNSVIAPPTSVDQTKAPGYRVNLRSPINPEPPLTPGSGDQQQTPSPKSTKSPHASSQDSPDPKQHQTATSTPSSDRKIWPPPIGTERASSMNHRRNTGSGMLHPNHGNAVEASNIWSSSVKADTWASLSVNQDVADENQKREQQTPEAVNEEKVSANPLEVQENLLAGRIPMYPNSQDALMQQASTAQAVISAQSNTSTSSLINPEMMSHAGIGTQPPIGSHLGTQAASHRQSMYLQQQQPIGAHLGNSMRGSIPMPQQQHQQRTFNPVIRGSQPPMPAMQQHAFNSQFQNEVNSPLLNNQHWQQRSKPANTFPQQMQPQHAKFTASEAIFKDNMGMQTNENSMQSQEYYMRMTGNNFNQPPIANPAGMFHEKIGVIGGGYGSGVMNSAPGAQLQNSQMAKRSFPLQSQFDGMNNTAAYPPQYKQEMYSNPAEMQDVGGYTPGQQNMMPNPALWDNNMYHQHQMHNNYDQFNSSSMGINGLENDMARGSQGVVGHQINGNNSWGW